ncbi:MAG TPA: hypothetical protein VMQ76_01255 [Terracidiphilus sp.]|nr:hypothetical protein [Terracidiphilus sp.]
MNASDLAKLIYKWVKANHGIYPPYWVLTEAEFMSVLDSLQTLNLAYNKPAKDVKSFRFMNVVIGPYDHALPGQGQPWA